MNPKKLALIVLVLAVFSGVVYFVQRPGPATASDPRVGQTLADAATIDKAAKLKLSDQGKTVELAKGADGLWHVTSYYDLPADTSKLTRFVSDLTEAKLQRLATTSPERIARLEFKDTQIAFSDAAGKELWSVTLGKNADNGGRFVRFGTEQKAYLATLNAWLDPEPKNWANSQLVDLKPDTIAKVELSFPDNAGATVVASRAKKEDPFVAEKTPDGKKLKPDSITSILTSFTGLRFSDTAEPNDPQVAVAKQHARTLKLTTFDGKTTTFTLGRKPEEKVVKAPVSDGAKAGPAAVLPSSPTPAEGPAKAMEPATETIPAGPVYVSIAYPDDKAPATALMQKRAVSISDYLFTSLPQKPDELFESSTPATPVPAPAPATQP
jgi:hypothetical protein